MFDKYNYKQLETETNQSVDQLVIKHFGVKPIEFYRDLLAHLLGIRRKLNPSNYNIRKRAYISNDILRS